MTLFSKVFWLAMATGASAYGQINVTGSVHDDVGAVPAGVVVVIRQVRAPAGRSTSGGIVSGPGISAVANVSQSGGFSFSGVPAGNYYICAYATSPGLISNCDWTAPSPPTSIRPAAGVPEPIALTVTRGTIVTFQLQDPAGLLGEGGHYFYPGVMRSDGYYAKAQLASTGTSARSYVVTIPNTGSVKVFIDSDLSITGPSGAQLAVRAPASLAVQGGANTTVVLSVQ